MIWYVWIKKMQRFKWDVNFQCVDTYLFNVESRCMERFKKFRNRKICSFMIFKSFNKGMRGSLNNCVILVLISEFYHVLAMSNKCNNEIVPFLKIFCNSDKSILFVAFIIRRTILSSTRLPMKLPTTINLQLWITIRLHFLKKIFAK